MVRKVAGTSVAALLVVAMLVIGTSSAFAVADFSRSYNSLLWTPPSGALSGITYVGDHADGHPEYLVVDQNLHESSEFSGWILNPLPADPGVAVATHTSVDENTGVHYDVGSDTLFIASDATSGSFIRMITGYSTGTPQSTMINTTGDTEDPAFDATEGVLYWVNGTDSVLNWRDSGLDTIFGNMDDVSGSAPITLEVGSDWEALTWDSDTGSLVMASSDEWQLYEFTVDRMGGAINPPHATTDIESLALENDIGDISGMGYGPSTFEPDTQNTLWITSRDSNAVIELTIDGTDPPPPPSTTMAPTTTVAPTTTPPTTAPTTTSTTTPGATTSTTTPGQTTTTTTPGQQPPPTSPSGFTDIGGNTHAADIEWLAAEGITKGCNPPDNTLFCPDDSVTRGQMAAFLGRAFGYTDAGTGNYFVDIIGNTFKTDIDRLRVAGVTLGCNPPTNDRYCPDDEVTRGQMAAFLGRAFGYTDAGSGNYFVDTGGNTFETDIDRLRVAGVTLGCNPPTNNQYCPDEPVTRGQMATFLRRGFANQ